eukprot:jgi/Astpho2/2664/Aster-07011
MVAMDLGPEARYKDVRCVKYERGYMVAMDLGPEARYKDVRCVKYERSASKGPWRLTGDVCWVARSLYLVRMVRCAQVMLSAMVLSLGSHWVHCPWILVRKVRCAQVVSAMVLSLRWCCLCDGVVSAMVLSPEPEEECFDVDLRAFAMQMMSAASPEEPAAHQPLSPVQLSPGARRQADALLATSRPRVRVTNAYWRKQRRSAAKRRADLDDHSGDYANQFSGLLLEVSHMHSADAIYKVVKGLKPQIRLHVELQRPSTVNDAMRLAQAADSALYYTRPTVDRQSDQTCQSSL